MNYVSQASSSFCTGTVFTNCSFFVPGARLKNTSSPNSTSVALPVATGAQSAGRRVDTKGRLVSLLKRIFFFTLF